MVMATAEKNETKAAKPESFTLRGNQLEVRRPDRMVRVSLSDDAAKRARNSLLRLAK